MMLPSFSSTFFDSQIAIIAGTKVRERMKAKASAMMTVSAIGTNVLPSTPVSVRSEEHTSELQSLMRISYAVFCLKKKKKHNNIVPVKYITHLKNPTLTKTSTTQPNNTITNYT